MSSSESQISLEEYFVDLFETQPHPMDWYNELERTPNFENCDVLPGINDVCTYIFQLNFFHISYNPLITFLNYNKHFLIFFLFLRQMGMGKNIIGRRK